MLTIYFLVPLFYFWSGDYGANREVVISYAEDNEFLLVLSSCYVLLNILLSWLSQQVSWSAIESRLRVSRLRIFSEKSASIIVVSWLIKQFLVAATLSPLSGQVSRSAIRLETYHKGFEGSFLFVDNLFRIVFFLALMQFFVRKRFFWFVFFSSAALELYVLLVTSLHRSPLLVLLASCFSFWVIYGAREVKKWYFSVILSFPILMSYMADYRSLQEFDAEKDISDRVSHGLTGLATAFEAYIVKTRIDEGMLDFDYGTQIFNNLIVVVPRIIWSEKPNVSFSSRMTEAIYGPIGPGNSVHTFSVWGEGYAQFGNFGVLLYTVALCLLVFVALRMWLWLPSLSFPLISYFLSLPLLLRGDFFAVVSRLYPFLIVAFLVYFLGAHRFLFRSNL